MNSRALTLIAADGTQLVPTGVGRREDSLLYWTEVYWQDEVLGSPDGTQRAKKADLGLFLGFFIHALGDDDISRWTPSVSKEFVKWLQTPATRPPRKYAKPYSPSSINRTLATLRHFARAIETRRKFEAGFPFKDVTDLKVQAPEWHGLSSLELMRLRAALDSITLRKDGDKKQNALRDRAAFIVALDTGLRAFELVGLNFEQYEGKYLTQVKGKGNAYSDIYLSSDARKELAAYVTHERGTKAGPLFLTSKGGRLTRQQLDRFLKLVAALANAKLRKGEEPILLHAHKLRHTSTKRVYLKKGPVEAKKFSRHQSFKQLERYATQTTQETEEMVDNLWS